MKKQINIIHGYSDSVNRIDRLGLVPPARGTARQALVQPCDKSHVQLRRIDAYQNSPPSWLDWCIIWVYHLADEMWITTQCFPKSCLSQCETRVTHVDIVESDGLLLPRVGSGAIISTISPGKLGVGIGIHLKIVE